MNIIILHGDDKEAITKRLDVFYKEAKKRSWDLLRVSKDSPLPLRDELSSNRLFTKDILHVVDFSLISAQDKKWLTKQSDSLDGTLVIFTHKLLTKTALKEFPSSVKTEEYKLPVLIWKFLDSVYPGNEKETLDLLHQTVDTEPIELVFSLLTKHVKDLYSVKIKNTAVDIPSWRAVKLKSQLKHFSSDSLERFIKGLARIDIESKTSKANLSNGLDLLFAKGIK